MCQRPDGQNCPFRAASWCASGSSCLCPSACDRQGQPPTNLSLLGRPNCMTGSHEAMENVQARPSTPKLIRAAPPFCKPTRTKIINQHFGPTPPGPPRLPPGPAGPPDTQTPALNRSEAKFGRANKTARAPAGPTAAPHTRHPSPKHLARAQTPRLEAQPKRQKPTWCLLLGCVWQC